MLPADGTYVVRVYLMRNAARRNESSTYTLDVAVTGQALAPLSAAKDALVAGTRFHATAAVPCQTPGADTGASCKAGVIRRGRDGTATVELLGANGRVRNLLFVKGQPVASDSAQPMTSSRQGDRVTVRFGEPYVLWDRGARPGRDALRDGVGALMSSSRKWRVTGSHAPAAVMPMLLWSYPDEPPDAKASPSQ